MALTRMQRRHQSVPHINVVFDLTFKTAAITAAMTQILHIVMTFTRRHLLSPHAMLVIYSRDAFYFVPPAQY